MRVGSLWGVRTVVGAQGETAKFQAVERGTQTGLNPIVSLKLPIIASNGKRSYFFLGEGQGQLIAYFP